MQGGSLHGRAIAFAASAGCVVFILALFAGHGSTSDAGQISKALAIAIVCGVFGWASAQQSIATIAASVDRATERLLQAAHGDLQSPIAKDIRSNLPDLSVAMESLFSQVRTNLDNVQTLAMFDPVTGLANRTSFYRQVERMLIERQVNGAAAMFFLDLDGFKDVNDRFGHGAGDQILARVAGRLREVVMAQASIGARDAVVGRLAGDEFTLFFPHMPPETSAMRIARAIQFALDEHFEIGGVQIDVGASIGVAYYPEHGGTLAALLRAADQAMYEAKHKGRRRVELYSHDLEARLSGRADLERDLRTALERDEFLLEFQPQVDYEAGRIVAAEALVRWAHPDRTLIMPDAFVALAEETGLIVELGDWIMNRVCHTAARWAAGGINHRLTINISARELTQPDFFRRFLAAMEEHKTPPAMLEIELTESLAMRLEGSVLDNLHDLRRRGILIAIDDFGTGFSNLSRLKDLPVDRVKIDRSLVRDILISNEARMICSAVVGLIQGLGLEVVIEGVESEDQVEMLGVIGCHIFQGFHLSRPVAEVQYMQRFGMDAQSPLDAVG
ncbi:MAG: EAL domain-containing protein [Sphingobium sp.]